MSVAVSESYAPQVAAEVRAWMGRRGMNQRAVCRELGVTPMWLSRRLSAQIVIDVEDLAALAKALRCEVSDLLPRLDSNQQPSG